MFNRIIMRVIYWESEGNATTGRREEEKVRRQNF